MAGFGHDDDLPPPEVPPEVEVFVVEGDGSQPPGHSVPGRDRRPPMPVAGRIGIVLGAAAIFAFGVVVGRSGLGGTRPVAAPSAASSVPADPSPAVPSASATAVSGVNTVSSAAASTMSTDVESTAPDSGTADAAPWTERAPWPLVRGGCGETSPAPFVDATGAQPKPIDAQLIAGSDPTPVDLMDGSVGRTLFTPDARHYVRSIATGDGATVLLVEPCDSEGPGRVVRIPNGGSPTDVALPADTLQAGLVGGGSRVWVDASEDGSYSFDPTTLVAADGSGDTMTLPSGLIPLGGSGRVIVAQGSSGGMPNGALSVFDTDSRRLTARFGSAGDDAVNAILDGDYVATAPWVCTDSGRCPIHRYNIATGQQQTVMLGRPADRILAGGGAISPDGKAVAIPLYGQPPAPAPYRPEPAATPSAGTTRVGLLDLEDGSLHALPGLTLGPNTGVALSFSPDGRWLIVAIGSGDRTRLVLYTADGGGPYLGADVRGAVVFPVMSRVSSR